MTHKELREMHLHEEKKLGNGTLRILRVPNGWIYTSYRCLYGAGVGDQWITSSSFVPEKEQYE